MPPFLMFGIEEKGLIFSWIRLEFFITPMKLNK